MLIKNNEGEDVEVFTSEEVEEKTKEILDGYKSESDIKIQELIDQQNELKTKLEEAESNKNDNKDENIKKMRNALNSKEKEMEDFKKQISEEISTIKSGTITEIKTEIFDSLTKDVEIKKKMEFFNDQFKDTPKTKAEMVERAKQVYTLATGSLPKQGIFDNGIISGGAGSGNNNWQQNREGESTESKEQRKLLGISDEDAKKYGSDYKQN